MRRKIFGAAAGVLALGLGLAGAGPALADDAAATGAAEAPAAATGASPALKGALRALSIGQMKRLSVHEHPIAPPAAPFIGPDGAPARFSDFKGKVVFVNLWATWCPPCLKELPSIDRLAAEKENDDFAVVALNIDRLPAERVAEFMAAKQIPMDNLKSYRDPDNKVPQGMAVIAMPTSFLFNREGVEIARFVGDAEWDSAEAKAVIDAIIAEKDGS